MNFSAEIGKKAAAEAAVEFVQEGMLLGLGTGSTVHFFIQRLAERCKEGLRISAVSSSLRSEHLAKSLGIPIVAMDTLDSLDMTVDGADEIDETKAMIKGGGGALLREKIVASMSKEMVVIVDSSKCVKTLGTHFCLPVEVLQFGWRATLAHLNKLHLVGQLRQKDNSLYITDNGNYIYDIHHESLKGNLKALNSEILSIPGVIETGFFFNLAGRVIVGDSHGNVTIL